MASTSAAVRQSTSSGRCGWRLDHRADIPVGRLLQVSADHIGMSESTQLTAAGESSVPPEGRRAQIAAGVTDSFSAELGIVPFGIALGLLVIQLGLPWWG